MPEFGEFTDFMIGGAGDKSEFGIAMVNGHGIRVELVVFLPYECKCCADLQFGYLLSFSSILMKKKRKIAYFFFKDKR